MSNLRQAAQQALEDICGAKLCEFNSMSSRAEMLRLMDSAIIALRAALAEPEWAVVARVSGFKGGECVIEPLNRASCLPVGTALCAHIQTVKEARLS